MSENQLLTVLTTILQQKGTKLKNNELFSILSLILMMEISDIYKRDIGTKTIESKVADKKSNLPSLNNIAGLISQFQGNDKDNASNNLQQLLPLLTGALGGGNNDSLDIGSLLQMLKSVQSGEEKKNEIKDSSDTLDQIDEEEEPDKKKAQIK